MKFCYSDSHLQSAKLREPNDRFVWNWRLIPPRFRPNAHRVFRDAGSDWSPGLFQAQWFIPLYHGAISQAAISACGLPLLITLIGRRSRHFAGTRFLKRGTSLLGNVANEVSVLFLISCVTPVYLFSLTVWYQQHLSVCIDLTVNNSSYGIKAKLIIEKPGMRCACFMFIRNHQ